MDEYIVKLRCPACKFEEEVTVEASNEAKAKTGSAANKHCPRQAHIKMEVIAANNKYKKEKN